jgi:hypothetical protein
VGVSQGAIADPTGEAGYDALRLDFDRHLLLQFRGPRSLPMPGCCLTAIWMTRWD